MNPVEYFADLIKQSKNPTAVSDVTIEDKDNLYRCYINVWSGMITVLQHNKNANDEIGKQIGSIFLDNDDNIITEIF